MASGFAGGLADGISSGIQLKNQMGLMDLRKQYADRDFEADKRKAEEHGWKKEDRERASETKKGALSFVDNLMNPSAVPVMPTPSAQPVMMNPAFTPLRGFAQGGLVSLKPKGFAEGGIMRIPDEAFAGNDAAAYQVGGLASLKAPAAPRQQAPAERREVTEAGVMQDIAKQMLTGNLMNDPDKMTAIQGALEQAGMQGVGKWMSNIYEKKKSGVLDGAMMLLRNDVDGAVTNLKRGGMELADRPVKVNPDDPEDNLWRINVAGTGERVVNIRNLIASQLDPKEFLKADNDRMETTGKRNVSDAQVRNYDSNVRVDNARIGKLGEETKSVRQERNEGALGGGGGGNGKLPSDAQMVEYLVGKGIVSSPQEAWRQVKTNGDKSPDAWRMSLIEANVKAGMPISDSAKEVDAFLSQGQGAVAPSANAVRKFNPKTGKFD